MSDLIDRQDAINVLCDNCDHVQAVCPHYPCKQYTKIEQLPSAQPEIIRCEDCANCQIDDVYHDYWCDGKKVWKDHFCGYAERRTDEHT